MRTIVLDGKHYQFSKSKFVHMCDTWKPEEHENLTAKDYITKHLCKSKDCYYNYYHGRNGMQQDDIFDLAALLHKPKDFLLEEKTEKEKEYIPMKETNNTGLEKWNNISDFSKAKIFQINDYIDECIFAFFATFDAQDEFFDLLEVMRKNSIAVPDELLDKIEQFIYFDLGDLVDNPEDIRSQLPPISDSIEASKTRNKKLNELEDVFMEEHYMPLRAIIKKSLLN